MDLPTCLPLVGAWAWWPDDVTADAEIDDSLVLNRFGGLPTLVVSSGADATESLCWKVDGYFSNSGVWLYITLLEKDLELLESQQFMQPGELLLNQDLPRSVRWARTKHDRIVNRGLLVVEPGTQSMNEILELAPVNPDVITSAVGTDVAGISRRVLSEFD